MSNGIQTSEKIGWFGKIPSSGDFIRRRLPDAFIKWWSNWFQNSLSYWEQEKPTFIRCFPTAPIWNFAIPATLGLPYVQLGCLLPGRDKVGRFYPICVSRYYKPEAWHPHQLDTAAKWYRNLGISLFYSIKSQQHVDQVDEQLLNIPDLEIPFPKESDILSVIGLYDPNIPQLAWPQVTSCFNAEQYTSFWWTNQVDGKPLITRGHSGSLTIQLFSQLFNLPQISNKISGSNSYPQMFT